MRERGVPAKPRIMYTAKQDELDSHAFMGTASDAGTWQEVAKDDRDATLRKVYASGPGPGVLVGGSTRNLAATERPLGSPSSRDIIR